MITYFNESIQTIELGDIKEKLPEAFINIYKCASYIYDEY